MALCLVPALAPAAVIGTGPDFSRSVDALLGERYADDQPGAAILIARGEHVLYRGARGLADVEAGGAMSPGQVMRLGSISKQLTAAGVLTLVQRGALPLEAPLSTFIPDYPDGQRITIRDLLGHTSGIPSYTSLPAVVQERIQHDATTAEIIDSFKHSKTLFAPGTGFAYSNSNYVLLAAVIESVTGMRWDRYLKQVLFDPLQMTHTRCDNEAGASEADLANGYSVEGGQVVPASPMSMTWAHAAAGCVSTVDDLLKWNRALHHGQVLDRTTYAAMVSPSRVAGGSEHGLGMFVEHEAGRLAYGHDGAVNGFMSSMRYLPATDIVVVVLENNDGGEAGEGPTALVKRLAALAVLRTQAAQGAR